MAGSAYTLSQVGASVILVYQEIEDLINSGAYGGPRLLSPSSEAILMSSYAGYEAVRWKQDNGDELSEYQRDTVEEYAARAQYELWREVSMLPVGMMVWSMVNPTNAPVNWLPADGRVINDYDYPELAQALGSEWLVSPSPPGVIQFRMPNMMAAYASGAPSGDMQTRVGANNVTLTTPQIPSHSHSYNRPFVQAVTYTPGPGPATFVSTFNASSASTGGGQPHENRPNTQYMYPYIVAASS